MSNLNIYIPTKINVGFQNRNDTYTGKLAYVIYYDEKGKLRKQTSWDNWRDQNIPNEEYENIPVEGFVLNKKVGGVEESRGYDPRKTYTRIYDPRGFEFEITIPNLLWILENCNCIKGKGLEGEFIYGWDGKELVLVPVDSPEYKTIIGKSDKINKQEFISPKDLVVGYTYIGRKADEKYVYLGRFDYWKEETNYYGSSSYSNSRYTGYEIQVDDTWHSVPWTDTLYRVVNKGKHYFFAQIHKGFNRDYIYITHSKNVSNRFIKCVDDKISDRYLECIDMLNVEGDYKPTDYNNIKVQPLPFENFNNMMQRMKNCRHNWSDTRDIYCKNSCSVHHLYYKKDLDVFEDDSYIDRFLINGLSIEQIYNKIQPVYITLYYMDGTEYKKMGWYNEDGTK